MKAISTLSVIFLFLFSNLIAAQEAKTGDWVALKNLQEVMERVSQPADEGNLLPIKTWSETLMQKADQLSAEAVPAKFDGTAMSTLITKLKEQSKMTHELVLKKQPDSAIKKSLSDANKILIEIVRISDTAK